MTLAWGSRWDRLGHASRPGGSLSGGRRPCICERSAATAGLAGGRSRKAASPRAPSRARVGRRLGTRGAPCERPSRARRYFIQHQPRTEMGTRLVSFVSKRPWGRGSGERFAYVLIHPGVHFRPNRTRLARQVRAQTSSPADLGRIFRDEPPPCGWSAMPFTRLGSRRLQGALPERRRSLDSARARRALGRCADAVQERGMCVSGAHPRKLHRHGGDAHPAPAHTLGRSGTTKST